MGSDEFKNHVITVNADELSISMDEVKMKTKNFFFDLRRPTLLDNRRLNVIPGGGYNHVFSESKSLNDCSRFHARYKRLKLLFFYYTIMSFLFQEFFTRNLEDF